MQAGDGGDGDVKGEVLCEMSPEGRKPCGREKSWSNSNALSQSRVRKVTDAQSRLRDCPDCNLYGQACEGPWVSQRVFGSLSPGDRRCFEWL